MARPTKPAGERKDAPVMVWVRQDVRDAFDEAIEEQEPYDTDRSSVLRRLIYGYLRDNGYEPENL